MVNTLSVCVVAFLLPLPPNGQRRPALNFEGAILLVRRLLHHDEQPLVAERRALNHVHDRV